MCYLLKCDGTFDLSAIMTYAVVRARREQAGWKRSFPNEPFTWRQAMAYGLRMAWQDARGQRLSAIQKAKIAAMTAEQLADEDRKAALFGAAMIDSTSRMLATVARIEANRPEMRA